MASRAEVIVASKAPAFQWYPRDYLTDVNVELMSLEQEGAYRRLMDYCWLHKTIPSDMASLGKLCRITTGRMERLWPEIKPCFRKRSGRLYHPRLDAERSKQMKWRGKSQAGGVRSARLRAARKLGTHTVVEWDTLLGLVGDACPRCDMECDSFHKDHVVPVYQEGSTDSIDNLQPLCPHCNKQKGPDRTDHVSHLRAQLHAKLNGG